ncbi:MAG: DNA helicase RecQ [Waddliaceae bacterium]|nr:DNA helicase RecQ [Waddliaceae bacterium]
MPQKILQEVFGFDSWRPLQEEAVNGVLSGQDAVVLMPTGGGKSLCYQIPALVKEGITIVISPLIALMKDQVEALRANGVGAAFWNSTTHSDELFCIIDGLRSGQIKLLYVAPERLQHESFRRITTEVPVALCAIDEAHCISDWGHDFRPEYRNLSYLKTLFPKVPLIALTATATMKVMDDIVASLQLKNPLTLRGSFDRTNLFYEVRQKQQVYKQILHYLNSEERGAGIIYCSSRKKVDTLAERLSADGFSVLPYHAGLTAEQRENNQDAFMKDQVQIIVATIAFGMGVDKSNIRFVIHHDLPKSVEAYYQETGRAGRDGLPSECIVFYSYADRFTIDSLLDQIEDEKEKERAKGLFSRMLRLVNGRRCRRKAILEYFGEMYSRENCGRCDICCDKVERSDQTDISYKILSAVVRLKQNAGMGLLIDVLRGADTAQVRQRGAASLSVYGIAKDVSQTRLRDLIYELLREEYLSSSNGGFPVFFLSSKAAKTLKERQKIHLAVSEHSVTKTRERKRQKDLDYDEVLFKALVAKRKEIADQRSLPSFVIFSDKSLQEMAYYIPLTDEEFRKISGVGQHKAAAFAQCFLELITKIAEDRGLRSRFHDGKAQKKLSALPGKALEAWGYLSRGESIDQTAKHLSLRSTTIISYIESLLEAGKKFDPAPFVDEEIMERVKPMVEDNPQIFLREIKEALDKEGLETSYEELKIVRAFAAHG